MNSCKKEERFLLKTTAHVRFSLPVGITKTYLGGFGFISRRLGIAPVEAKTLWLSNHSFQSAFLCFPVLCADIITVVSPCFQLPPRCLVMFTWCVVFCKLQINRNKNQCWFAL